MTSDKRPPASRTASRLGVLAVGVALTGLAGPAIAAPPNTWESPDNPPAIQTLLYLLGVPLLVFAVTWVLVYLPSMMRRDSATPAVAFQQRSEWFGGPRDGAEAAAQRPADGSEKGGAGARW